MYTVTKVMTNDGQMFDNERDARHHLENVYDGALSKLALLIRGNDNAISLKLIIDDNIDVLKDIIALKSELDAGIEEESR